MNYYSRSEPSYSYLSKLLTPFFGKESDLEFGRQFHQTLLEPQKASGKHSNELIRCMVQACLDKFGYDHFYGKGVRREWEYYRKIENLYCKGKLDIVSASGHSITDYKTTALWSDHMIPFAVDAYNYDMQAFMYLNFEKRAEFFRLVFVQKSKKPKIWPFLIYRDDCYYFQGRKKFLTACEIHKTQRIR